ncbi:MAG TPA: CoA-transferase, partial [Alphaproteobacteria bacterium]|nr:CoA-transferase [Alphaproteobacteria bacterium]
MECRLEELLIDVIARLLEDSRHIAVGMASPIPGSAALLRQHLSKGATRVSILQSARLNAFTNGGVEVFDLAAQGRIDTFFLSGGQIDGQGNVNLVGVGDYPRQEVRWSGSFGSAYLYFIIPKVILFRLEHTRRVMVPKVDFVSAPGVSPPNVHRPGGPRALVTNLCLFAFDQEKGRFRLVSVHPGHTLEEVRDNTGFDFDVPDNVPVTPEPDERTLEIVRGSVSRQIANAYPRFAAEVWGIEEPAQA